MNHPSIVRDRVLASVANMLEQLRIRISCYNPDELQVLKAIERPQQYEMALELTNFLMARLGHATAPKEPRFDKTRRAMNKRKPKAPRGLKLAGDPVAADAEIPNG
jgi:hypothetical protein